MKKPKKKVELFKYKGCKDCTKNCLWNGLVTIKESREREKFPCNSSFLPKEKK